MPERILFWHTGHLQPSGQPTLPIMPQGLLQKMLLPEPRWRLRSLPTELLLIDSELPPVRKMHEHDREERRLQPHDLPLRVSILLLMWRKMEKHA